MNGVVTRQWFRLVRRAVCCGVAVAVKVVSWSLIVIQHVVDYYHSYVEVDDLRLSLLIILTCSKLEKISYNFVSSSSF